jgi:hypothetical protein
VRFGAAFVGHSEDFTNLVSWARQHPAPKGLAALR